MRQTIFKALAWLSLYVAAIVLPIVVFMAGDVPAGRGFWIEFGALLGFAALLVIALQFILTARFRWVAPPFGTDTILQFHRQAGILALAIVLVHPIILFISDPGYLEYLDPRVNAPRTIFLILATIAMVLLIVLPLWRFSFGLSYEWWRVTHGLLSAGVILVGAAHAWQVGHYVDGWGKRGLLIAIGGAALLLLIHVRIVKPWRMRQRPYRVAEVRQERGESSTIVVEPVGHPGFRFRGGQYAWLTLGKTPFTLQQHPFSFSSSDQDAPQRIEFTAKELGDFTEQLTEVEPGTPAFLEGPYGVFCLDDDAPGAVYIMGGIGVTPTISMLRSFRDKKDPRPFVLIYGNVKWRETAFRKELADLQGALNLRVVHVIAEPEADWDGEAGFSTQELLERNIGERERTFPMFVCGPEPMMNMVEAALLEMKIPLHQTRSERFNIV